MSSDITRAEGRQLNRRPELVTSLLHEWQFHDAWAYANRRAARFYVINLPVVLGNLAAGITKFAADFDEAERVIAEDTKWPDEHRSFEYECSHTQIYNIGEPKSFGRAATIIVAMEIAAARELASLNVYDYLRILPAHYFVDRFDSKRLTDLEAAHEKMRHDEKVRKFGALAQKSFEEILLTNIEQSREGLIRSLTDGYCVTRYTAEKLMTFVNTNYPDLDIGPIRSSGQHSLSEGLGLRNAAQGLRVPRTIDPNEFSACR